MLQTVEARALKLSALTPKERECLRLVAQQCSSKEIARELGISKASVDTYCNRARAKLGVDSRRAAAQLLMTLEHGAGPLEPASPAAAANAPGPPAQAPPVLAPPVLAPTPFAAAPLIPPLSSLGPMARLGIILGGAVALALAFGMLLSGLQTLNNVAEAARANAQAAAPTAQPQRR
jgi:DNA-binding CsgD family transcriptional regulator